MAPPIGSDLRSCLSTSTGLFNERVPGDWGTQRARLRVDAAADLVLAELPWRRHERPAIGGGVVAVGPNGGRIEHAGIVNSSTESGVVAFSATRAGEYHVYWLPYRQRLTGEASTVKSALARSGPRGHPPPPQGPARSLRAAVWSLEVRPSACPLSPMTPPFDHPGGTCDQSYLHAAADGAAAAGRPRRRAAKRGGGGGGYFGGRGGGGRGGGGGAPSGWVAQAVRTFSAPTPAAQAPPRAVLVAMESRGRRYQRHAGELSARASEVRALLVP